MQFAFDTHRLHELTVAGRSFFICFLPRVSMASSNTRGIISRFSANHRGQNSVILTVARESCSITHKENPNFIGDCRALQTDTKLQRCIVFKAQITLWVLHFWSAWDYFSRNFEKKKRKKIARGTKWHKIKVAQKLNWQILAPPRDTHRDDYGTNTGSRGPGGPRGTWEWHKIARVEIC